MQLLNLKIKQLNLASTLYLLKKMITELKKIKQ